MDSLQVVLPCLDFRDIAGSLPKKRPHP